MEKAMRNERKGLLDVIEVYIDMFLNLSAILIAYFFAMLVKGESISEAGSTVVKLNAPWTVAIIAVNVLAASFVFHVSGLYHPTRYQRRYRSLPAALKATLMYYGPLALVILISTRKDYVVFFLFWALFAATFSTSFLTFKRHLIKVLLRGFRRYRYNLRKIIIVGDNADAAREYIKQVNDNSEYGTMLLGFVGDKMTADIGIDKLGSFSGLADILDKEKPTDVVFAIDAYDKRHLIRLVNMCDDRCIRVYFLPVTYGFFKSPRQIEQVGSIPVINVHSTPLDNVANAALKRAFDILISALMLTLLSPVMIVAAIGVRLSSPGPILFRQMRVGKMGKRFMMLKFRSMRINSLSNKGWTTNTDSRKTKFGNFIRKTAIDELPQLINVLKGDMSLIGPRPEIPVFVEQFKETIPLYMVKHYVKPGMTGLAQIKGLRGDTSVEDRIHEDIEYIENWSFLLDMYIFFKTPFTMINKNEKYVYESPDGELLDDETTRDYK